MQPSKNVSNMERWEKIQVKKQVEEAINNINDTKANTQYFMYENMDRDFYESVQKIKNLDEKIRPIASQLDFNGVRSKTIGDYLKTNNVDWAKNILARKNARVSAMREYSESEIPKAERNKKNKSTNLVIDIPSDKQNSYDVNDIFFQE